MNSENGVEQMRQADPMSFGNKPEKVAITIKAPRAAQLHDFNSWLVVSVEQLVRDFAFRRLVGELQSG